LNRESNERFFRYLLAARLIQTAGMNEAVAKQLSAITRAFVGEM
jgi:hypothetical protein